MKPGRVLDQTECANTRAPQHIKTGNKVKYNSGHEQTTKTDRTQNRSKIKIKNTQKARFETGTY